MSRGKAKKTRIGGFLQKIARGATKATPAGVIASQIVKRRAPKIREILKRNGIKPAPKSVNLAIQAAQLMEEKAVDKAMEMGLAPEPEMLTPEDIDMAEEQVYEDEERAIEEDPENGFDSFDPATIAATFGAAKAAVGKINAKRQAAGKRPLLRGKKWEARQKKAAEAEKAESSRESARETAGNSAESERETRTERKQESTAKILKDAAESVVNKVEQDRIRQYMPLFIIAGIVLFFAGKNS